MLSSGVLLSQIPYTGISANAKMILFVVGMVLWSAFGAWMLMRKRGGKEVKKQVNMKEAIAQFKQNNLVRKQALA